MLSGIANYMEKLYDIIFSPKNQENITYTQMHMHT